MKTIRIGTRKSPLAIMQAEKVAAELQKKNLQTEIIPIDSAGDIDLVKPIYELGITGVFTKNLDIALLNNTIDMAVHSLKDIPTQLPKNIVLSAVLARDYEKDILVWNPSNKEKTLKNATLGTGSLRRMAFLKNIEPSVTCKNIRGNVQTRLQKMKTEGFDAVVFSEAGLRRMQLDLDMENIPKMISAAGQGVIAITSRDNEFSEILKEINHQETAICTQIERTVLSELEGGCTAPIGVFAFFENEKINIKAAICSLEGKQKIELEKTVSIAEKETIGKQISDELKANGAAEILQQIKKQS